VEFQTSILGTNRVNKGRSPPCPERGRRTRPSRANSRSSISLVKNQISEGDLEWAS